MAANGVRGTDRVAGGGGGRNVSFEVALPGGKATRKEIARAVFRQFGLGDADADFLRRRFGTDPIEHFARTLEFNPRSVKRDGANTTIRISLSESDYNSLRALAAERRASVGVAPGERATVAPTNPATAVAARDGIAGAQNTRAALEQKLPQGNTAASTQSEEGVGSFVEGAIVGDFTGNESWSKVGGQTVVGLIPVVGQIADARDTVAALRDVAQGKDGAWLNLGATAVGWVPLFGDVAKGAFRVGRRALREGGEEVTEQVMRRGTREGVETAQENADVLQRRGFYEPTTNGDPNMPAGYGETDKYGNVTYSTAGTPTDRALVLHHEKVHQFLSPKFNLLREFRADARMTLYQKSSFMRYLEEAMAETYAQLRVNGIKGLPDGIRFPVTNGYVELRHVVTEGAVGAVTVGGVTYGAYVISTNANGGGQNDR